MKEAYHVPNDSHYEVSNCGRVRNSTTKRLMPQYIDKQGYAYVLLPAQIYIHRLVVDEFDQGIGVVRHVNDMRLDNRWPENICRGTIKDNARDRIRNGLRRNGSRNSW